MAKEQHIIARDFLGLGHTDENALPKAVDQDEGDEEMSKQDTLVKLGPSLSLFQDVQPKPLSYPKASSNPSGWGMRLDFSNQNVKRIEGSDVNPVGGQANGNTVIVNLASYGNNHSSSLGSQGATDNQSVIQKSWLQVGTSLSVKGEAAEDGSKLNNGEKDTVSGNCPSFLIDGSYRHYVQERGMWNPWRKSAVIQQAIHVEKSCQDLPGNIASPEFHSSQAVNCANINQAFGLHRAHGNITSKNNGPSVRNEVDNKLIVHARHLGAPTDQCGFKSIGPVAVNPPGKIANPQLTIFYEGMVNVFDDVPAEKAQAIMVLAGSGVPLLKKAGNSAGLQSMSSMPAGASLVQPSSPSSHPIASSHPITSSHSSRTQSPQKHSSVQVGQIGANPLVATAPSQIFGLGASKQEQFLTGTPGTPSKQNTVTNCPATTVRALPQARKASLARFLEKRKERVFSKMPYSMVKGPEDSMLSQGDKPSAGSGIDETLYGMEERVALLEDVATNEMEAEENAWFQKKRMETEKHASEADCCSISLAC